MTKPKVEVLQSELETHANSVDDCLTTVNDAKGASKHIKLGGEAYGLLCQWLPPILSGKHDTFDRLLKRAEKVLLQDSSNLRQAAYDFKTVDRGNSKAIKKVAEGFWE